MATGHWRRAPGIWAPWRRLTPAAYAHGLALAMPTKVAMARPTGVGRVDATSIRIPIEGTRDGRLPEGAGP